VDLVDLNRQYLNNNPFPHIVLNNAFENDELWPVVEEIDAFNDWDGEKQFFGSQNKRYCGTLKKLPPHSRNLIQYMNGPDFLGFLEKVTGIPHLVPDPYLEGGGFHSIGRGGFLKIHADFNWHHRLHLHRRLNVLLYLNTDWEESWGGALELWDSKVKSCVKKIPPKYNTMAIFSTTDSSFHGHPDPLMCPNDTRRKSIALYYYTSERPEIEVRRGRSSQTDYKSRPGEDLIPSNN